MPCQGNTKLLLEEHVKVFRNPTWGITFSTLRSGITWSSTDQRIQSSSLIWTNSLHAFTTLGTSANGGLSAQACIGFQCEVQSFLVGNMYRPPNGVATILNKLEDMLERAASENKRVILMGDLNINLLVPSGLASRLLLTSDNNLR